MVKKKKILVILGGDSRERKVSLETGKACYKAIKRMGYKVKKFDPAKKFLSEIKKSNTDIIFNALHGKNGEDGISQSYFEYLKIPYTHSGVISSMTAMNKVLSKKIFVRKKILTPKYIVLSKKDFEIKILKAILRKKKLIFPLVVKPISEGSSIGVKICKRLTQLHKEIKKLFREYDDLIIEKFISGKEIQVAVMNGKSLGAIELKPRRSFYDYKAKYSRSARTIHIMPAELKKNKYREVLTIAKKAHISLKCRGVTRSDFKFYNNKFYLLEINTQPGMTNLSLVPEIAKHIGINFKDLVEKILQDASINR